ncbi:MAG: DUF4428 domain-containing protein [Solobacterium sp.]|nr:DUF4428 domain-containing protein [Solobacterium sp.]
MGLFDKKICAICGKEIGLLGNRKLADGNMCKDCARLLSPWYSDRKHSTIQEIEAHLAYRIENQKALEQFHPTKILGGNTKVYIDEATNQFLISKNTNWKEGNPDIFQLSQVLGVNVEIEEEKEEIFTTNSEGKKVSYDPKQYEFEYLFHVEIPINSDFCDELRFDITDGKNPTKVNDPVYKQYDYVAKMIQASLMPQSYMIPEEPSQEPEPIPLNIDVWKCECGVFNNTAFCGNCGRARPVNWYCPKCGRENDTNFCVACGTKKPSMI